MSDKPAQHPIKIAEHIDRVAAKLRDTLHDAVKRMDVLQHGSITLHMQDGRRITLLACKIGGKDQTYLYM